MFRRAPRIGSSRYALPGAGGVAASRLTSVGTGTVDALFGKEPAAGMLYGRDQQVADLLRAREAVTLISGDIGVGKTEFLREVGRRFEGVAPAPVTVGHSPASLQSGLLDALGAAAAMVAQDQGAARRVGHLLVEGARRLAQVKANDIGLAVARLVLGVMRDRVGENVTDLLLEYAGQVKNAATDDLMPRIRQAADPDVIYAIAALAAETAEAAGGRGLLLSLDNIHDLQRPDHARLMDLGAALPSGVSVTCAFTSLSRADESLLDEYRLAGVAVCPLQGLEPWAIGQWLNAEGIATAQPGQVWRKTNGYGLAVAGAVSLLKAGKDLADADMGGRHAIIQAATRQALRGLDMPERAVAFKLSVLEAPLPAPCIADYLKMDPAVWIATEGALVDSHIFVPGNPPWFHEQRRKLLRGQVPGSEIAVYLNAAAAQLMSLARMAGTPAETLIQYADVSDDLAALGNADSAVAAVAKLTDSALAVLGAVLELTEPGCPAADAEQVLLYARRVFGASGDLAAAMREASAAGLAATVSDRHRTVVAASLGTQEAWLYANGRIGKRLGRMPLPRVASLVFRHRLASSLGPFANTSYGIGSPSAGELARQSVQLQVRPPAGQHPRPGRKGPSLLLRGLFGDTPVFAAVTYESQQDRDTALKSLRTLPPEPIFGRSLKLSMAAPQPQAPLPPRRLIRAFERALGLPIGNIHSSFDVTIHGEKISPRSALDQRLGALNLLAELSIEHEKQVTGHAAAEYGLLWWAGPGGNGEMTAVVSGARGIITLTDIPVPVLQRLDRAAISQLAGLAPHQEIGFTELRAGAQSPVADMQLAVTEAVRHARLIIAYNQHQPRRHLPSDPASLQALIQQQLDDREAAARRIAEFYCRSLPPASDIYLLIDPHVHNPGMIPGAGQDATIIETAMSGSSPRIRVAVEPPSPDPPAPASFQHWQDSTLARWSQIFDEPGLTPRTVTPTSVLNAVSRLLGHMHSELWLDGYEQSR
jgi:hypothetical protein